MTGSPRGGAVQKRRAERTSEAVPMSPRRPGSSSHPSLVTAARPSAARSFSALAEEGWGRGGGGVGVQEEEATPLRPQQARAGQACRPLSPARPRTRPCGPLPPSASLAEAWTVLRLGLQKLLSPSAHVPRLHFLCLQNEINTSRL